VRNSDHLVTRKRRMRIINFFAFAKTRSWRESEIAFNACVVMGCTSITTHT
jgi:hypothetical protein